jgi:thymidylate synthase
MNTLDKKYTDLLQDILDNGIEKETRNGKVLSVFGRQIRHNMKDGFPLITTKKMYFKGIVTESIWFLRGDTNIKFLLDNGCHIWTGDAYRVYDIDFDREHPAFSAPYPKRLTQKEFEEKIMTDDEFNKWYGDLGPVYGKQWREWKHIKEGGYLLKNGNEDKGTTTKYIDQIANLIRDLKTNPDSRRLMVNAWNVGELDQMTLPPCHYGFQVYTRELSLEERRDGYFERLDKPQALPRSMDSHEYFDSFNIPKRAISLMWNQRSVDTPLGLPFNIASYGLLLEIIGKLVNMVPDELIGNLGDCHIYLNQIDGVKEQIGRELTYKERYDIWFESNYQTGMEYNLEVEQDFDNKWGDNYIEVPPYRTREPYPLPKLSINTEFWLTKSGECGVGDLTDDIDSLIKSINIEDFEILGYKSHPTIKMPLSN